MKKLNVEPPYKERPRKCDLCGYEWKLCYNYIKNPNWCPAFICPECNNEKMKLAS